LPVCASPEPAEVNDYRDQKPQEIDSGSRHTTVDFPSVDDRRKRKENEAKHRQQQTTVESSL
jgi:hypothetical protein